MALQCKALSDQKVLKADTQSILADILSGVKDFSFNVAKNFLNAHRLTLGGHTQK